MSISNAYIYNFKPDGSNDFITAAVTGSSATAALPLNTETLMVQATGNIHFRISTGASTAIQNDPLMSAQQGPVVVKLSPSIAYNISYVLDTNQTGTITITYGKVMEA